MRPENKKWEEIYNFASSKRGNLDRMSEFIKAVDSSGVDPEIAREVKLRLAEALNGENVIFIFTENDYVITAIHVPAESIDGQDGPVLMRGAGEKSIIAAFSNELIIRKIENLEYLEEQQPGLHNDDSDLGVDADSWVNELENMADEVRMLVKANPPERWEDLLGGN